VRNLILLGVVGLFAQMIDGSLGMAYGVTSSSLLLATGIAPAAASAAVHLSEVGTTLVSGAAHWRFGNVDWRVVGIMAVPGGIFAFIGATWLSSIPGDEAKPWVSLLLLFLGGYVIHRFLRLGGRRPTFRGRVRARFLIPLAAVAGTMDAVGGGGWGPVGTTSLLAWGRLEPRKVVGSIDTAEFVVAVGASLGFLFALDSSDISLAWAGALLAGGVLAAPVAAYLVRHMPPRILGTAAGGLIVITNAKTVLESSWIGLEKDSATVWWTMGFLVVVLISLIVTAVQAERVSRRDTGSVASSA
jgi:uncharacterized membrane protein YfcA